MKKIFLSIIFIFSFANSFTDSFTDAIQDLAIQTACVGMYSRAEAGGGWYEDPHDYYIPQDIAEHLAKMSGNMTRTATFYGVCFDYAQFAFNDVQKYSEWYRQQGMYENQFWIAGVDDNYNIIELMSSGSLSDYTRMQNGVYVKTYSNNNRSVKAHGMATHHAWLWIQRADGVWFWIDPTWTDNLGYVVYGYISNGEEVRCRPDSKFCKTYPPYLNTLPLPPAMGQRKAPSKTVNSTNRQETINDATILSALDNAVSDFFINVDYEGMNDYIGVLFSASVPFNSEKKSFGLEFPFLYSSIAILMGAEYVQNVDSENEIRAGLLEVDLARRLFNNLAWYIGGGVGLGFDSKEESLAYVWKVDTGFILNIGILFSKIEISFDKVMGLSVGTGIGFGLEL